MRAAGAFKVVHLVDDLTAGGVMKVVDHLTASETHRELANQQCVFVKRGRISVETFQADIVVSHLTISWKSLPALIALKLANRHAKLVHVEHSYTEGFVQHKVPDKKRFYTLLRLGFAVFDRVVAVSYGQQSWLKQLGLVSAGKLRVIRSYSDMAPFLYVPAPNGPIRHFGAIGRLSAQKGFDTLITDFRKIPDPELRLTFFGKGEEEETLQKLASGDDRISFASFPARAEDVYSAVDAVVMPSRWEAYGLVAVEAICSGRDVYCADVDGLIDHRQLGAVVAGGLVQDAIRHGSGAPRTQADRVRIAFQLACENLTGWEGLFAELMQSEKISDTPTLATGRLGARH